MDRWGVRRFYRRDGMSGGRWHARCATSKPCLAERDSYVGISLREMRSRRPMGVILRTAFRAAAIAILLHEMLFSAVRRATFWTERWHETSALSRPCLAERDSYI